jgi:glycosyltransferase involved in cell wall biosynthesis
MRRSGLTVVNDAERIPLQREYAGLPEDHPVIVYPGCFQTPPAPGDRQRLRGERGIPQESFLLAYSGVLNEGNGALWMVRALEEIPDIHVWGQLVGTDSMTRGLLRQVRGAERLTLEQERLGWRESWSSMAAADAGMVVYQQEAQQYRHMGISSNRLCMFLAMGIPVIANRQPSFQFIEDYECGVLVEREQEFPGAVEEVRARRDEMAANALRAAREYIDAPAKYEALRSALQKIV